MGLRRDHLVGCRAMSAYFCLSGPMALMASNRASGGRSGRKLTISQLGPPASELIGAMRTDWRTPHPGCRRATFKQSAWINIRPLSNSRRR